MSRSSNQNGQLRHCVRRFDVIPTAANDAARLGRSAYARFIAERPAARDRPAGVAARDPGPFPRSAFDVGQLLGDLSVPYGEYVDAADVAVAPVVAPPLHNAVAGRDQLFDGE